MAALNSSEQPSGVAPINAHTSINNNYLYPRRTVPRMLPNSVGGLVRGWLYPMDVDQGQVTRYLTRNTTERQESLQEFTTASQKARQEMAMERARERIRKSFEGTTVPPSSVENALADVTPIASDYLLPTYQGVGYDTSPLAQSQRDPTQHPKTIREKEGKQFQFNPFSVDLSFQLSPSAPPESLQPGGTAATTLMTNASTGVKMYFDRSIEVAAANKGIEMVNGYKVEPDFRNIGVQKDIWDVFRICLGGDDDYYAEIGRHLGNIEEISSGTVLTGSASDMVSRVFDIGIASQQAWGRPVAVYYNANFVIAGFVAGLNVTYAEFNANFVPTKAVIDLAIQVYQATSESGVAGTAAAAADPNATIDTVSTDDEVPNSSSTTTTSTTRGSIVTTRSSTATNYRISGTNIRLDV